MRFFPISPDAHGKVDGTVQANLLNHLPKSHGVHDADILVVPISHFEDYQFRRDLPAIIGNKRWVLMDFCELGLEWPFDGTVDSHVFGRNNLEFPRVSTKEWMLLNAFVQSNPPLVYFKRELLAREHSDRLVPIEFPAYLPVPALQSKPEFDSRPVEAFHFWGLSHASRPRLHGDIFRHAYGKGYEVLSEWGHWTGFFSDPRKRVWASIHAPHFARVGTDHLQHYLHRSKITVSLPGAGYHCFRDTESLIGSIPAYWHSAVGWSYPFQHGVNCIELRPEREWEDLYEATQRTDLYDIYVESQKAAEFYYGPNFIQRHIIPSIEKRI